MTTLFTQKLHIIDKQNNFTLHFDKSLVVTKKITRVDKSTLRVSTA